MYTIKVDNDLIYTPGLDELQVLSPKLRLEVGKAGELTFTILPSHPLYDRIFRFRSIVEVFQNGKNTRLFRGRVLDSSVGFFNEKNIICEGELSYFNDSILRPYVFSGSIVEYLSLIIDNHNSQVENNKKFTLGIVTVTDPNDYIVRENIESEKSWDALQGRLIEYLGGFLFVRRENEVNYIDYLIDSTHQSLQDVRFGENLIDLQTRIKGTDVITALIPYGSKIVDSEGQYTEDRLTIESVNDGLDYVYNTEAVDTYGWIFGTQTWDDVELAGNLKTKALSELARRMYLNVSIELSAVDLSSVDISFDEFRLFEYVKIFSDYHMMNEYRLITKMDIDLLEPSNNKLTLGFNYTTLTEKQKNTDAAIKKVEVKDGKPGITYYIWIKYADDEEGTGISDAPLDKKFLGIAYNKLTSVESEDPLDYEWSPLYDSQAIADTMTTLQTNIETSESSIRTEISESYISKNIFEEYQRTISSSFDQTSDGFEYKFTVLTQLINDLDDDTKTTFSEFIKYIRFVDGNIVLGEVNNEITLKIENDRISFLQNGAEVAYFSNNKLYVLDATILSSLRIGDYAFLPRSNGNISFKWVGGV